MIIFAAMLIPFITALVLWIGFRRKTLWWEFALPFVGSFIIGIFFHLITSAFLAQKTEYWGGWLVDASYYEAWNEKVYYTERVYAGTDSKGRSKYRNVTKSRIDEHRAKWIARGSNGESYSLSSEEFNEFVHRWNNNLYIDLHRHYYSKNGNEYRTKFDSVDAHMETTTSTHSYENRVAISKSVFNFPKVSDKDFTDYHLVNYPENQEWWAPCVLGTNVPSFAEAEKRLSVFNAKRGAIDEVHVWMVIFKEQSLEAAIQQQNLWKNGNQNEFVICIDVDGENVVQWGHVFSWTNSTALTVEARDFVNAQQGSQVNLVKITEWVEQNLPGRWKRKDFAKDFSYIRIGPPTWAIVTTFLLTILMNVGISFFIVKNEFEESK